MSTQVTITLPDEVYQRAERFAHLANRDVASVLADSIHSPHCEPWLTDKTLASAVETATTSTKSASADYLSLTRTRAGGFCLYRRGF